MAFKLAELRASLLEVETTKDAKSGAETTRHSKHVAIELLDADACAAIQAILEKSLSAEQSAAGIATEDQFTLENCEDGSKFQLSGNKTLTDEEKKKFAGNKKKKAA
jgi:hypothetical protein